MHFHYITPWPRLNFFTYNQARTSEDSHIQTADAHETSKETTQGKFMCKLEFFALILSTLENEIVLEAVV